MMMRVMLVTTLLLHITNPQILDDIETQTSLENNHDYELLQSIQNEIKSLNERIPELDNVDNLDESQYWIKMAGDFRKAIRKAIDQSFSNATARKDELENYLKESVGELMLESVEERSADFELSDNYMIFKNGSKVRNVTSVHMIKELKTANLFVYFSGNQC